MPQIKRGDIIYVIEAYSYGSEQHKDRPAIVVSNNLCNTYSPVIEVVYLTSRTQKIRLPTQVIIDSAKKRCMAQCEQVDSVDKGRLREYIGTATTYEMRKLTKRLGCRWG